MRLTAIIATPTANHQPYALQRLQPSTFNACPPAQRTAPRRPASANRRSRAPDHRVLRSRPALASANHCALSPASNALRQHNVIVAAPASILPPALSTITNSQPAHQRRPLRASALSLQQRAADRLIASLSRASVQHCNQHCDARAPDRAVHRIHCQRSASVRSFIGTTAPELPASAKQPPAQRCNVTAHCQKSPASAQFNQQNVQQCQFTNCLSQHNSAQRRSAIDHVQPYAALRDSTLPALSCRQSATAPPPPPAPAQPTFAPFIASQPAPAQHRPSQQRRSPLSPATALPPPSAPAVGTLPTFTPTSCRRHCSIAAAQRRHCIALLNVRRLASARQPCTRAARAVPTSPSSSSSPAVVCIDAMPIGIVVVVVANRAPSSAHTSYAIVVVSSCIVVVAPDALPSSASADIDIVVSSSPIVVRRRRHRLRPPCAVVVVAPASASPCLDIHRRHVIRALPIVHSSPIVACLLIVVVVVHRLLHRRSSSPIIAVIVAIAHRSSHRIVDAVVARRACPPARRARRVALPPARLARARASAPASRAVALRSQPAHLSFIVCIASPAFHIHARQHCQPPLHLSRRQHCLRRSTPSIVTSIDANKRHYHCRSSSASQSIMQRSAASNHDAIALIAASQSNQRQPRVLQPPPALTHYHAHAN